MKCMKENKRLMNGKKIYENIRKLCKDLKDEEDELAKQDIRDDLA